MKPLFLVAATLIAAPIAHGCMNAAVQKTPTSSTRSSQNAISRANFVALKWERSGGYAGVRTQMLIHNGFLQLHRGAPENQKPSQIKALSKAEFQSILKLLNDAQFTKIAGKYNAPNLADGFGDIVTLTLQTPGAKPQVFTVENYGELAPKAFYNVLAALQKLQKKFATPKN